MKIMAVRSFETSGIGDPAKRRNNPDDLLPLVHAVGTASCGFGVAKNRRDLLLTILCAFVASCWCMIEYL